MYGVRPLNKDNILALISEQDIFRFYEPNFVREGALFCSSMREDRHPTCGITSRGGGLVYRDFAIAHNPYDFIEYIRVKFGDSYKDALTRIRGDFSLKLFYNGFDKSVPVGRQYASPQYVAGEPLIERPTKIAVEFRPWNTLDRNFWFTRIGITRVELSLFNVHPLKLAVIDSARKGEHIYVGGGNFYGYYLGKEDGRELWKLYNPFSTKFQKWRTNAPENCLQGYSNLPETGDLLVITKSLKDVIVLHKLGYSAVAPNSENIYISEECLRELRRRFKQVVLLYDNDDPGLQMGDLMSEAYNMPVLYFDRSLGKDSADVAEAYGYAELKSILEWMLMLQRVGM